MSNSTVKKSVATTPYDVAEHLRTPEEMAAYLDAWLEEAPEDAAGIAKALGHIARAKGMTQVAKDAGLSRESLYRALSADGNPSFATVLKVAKALGVKLHAVVACSTARQLPHQATARADSLRSASPKHSFQFETVAANEASRSTWRFGYRADAKRSPTRRPTAENKSSSCPGVGRPPRV